MPGRAHHTRTLSSATPRRAFTLPELLVVIGVMAILTLIAVGAFRSLTGSKSVESANNQLAGILGRVRGEAIGLQETRGVAFFLDPDTQRVQVIDVHQSQYPTFPPANPAEVYLDAVPDRDVILLPDGVGLEMIDDAAVTDPGTPTNPYDDIRQDDAYIGFNAAPNGFNHASASAPGFLYGGAILFDSYGRVIQRRIGFKFYIESASGAKSYSELAKVLGMDAAENTLWDFPAAATPVLRSQIGFVAFESEAFANNVGPAAAPVKSPLLEMYTDPQILGVPYGTKNTGTDQYESVEEKWLDDNSIPMLVNRNNGTLVRGE